MDAMRLFLWAGAALSGVVGWSGRLEWLPVATLVLVLWRLSRSRLDAFGVAAAYYAAPSFGWMRASSVFFGSEAGYPMKAILVWIGAGALLALPWGLLWSRRFSGSTCARLARGSALGAILMLPPLGLFSWCNPWVAGATALPGMGLAGLGLVTLGAFVPGSRSWPLWVALCLVVSALACNRYDSPQLLSFAGLSTRYGKLSEVDVEARYDRAVSIVRTAESIDAEIVLLPEGVAGDWTRSTEALFTAKAAESDRVLIVGALEAHPGQRRNGLAIVEKGRARFWSQRLPAPVGMWAPWRSSHVQSALFASSVRDISGRRVSMLLCFEQFVSWPAFQTALQEPDVVLAPANLWFAKRTNLNAVREVTLQSWAGLMGWSVVEAING